MHLHKRIKHGLKEEYARLQLGQIQKRFSAFTMVSRDTFIDNLRLAGRVAGISGCVIECGVWRGGMSAGLATVLGSDRKYFLFDSFEGLPEAKKIDGEAALAWQSDKQGSYYYDNCTAEPDFAQRAMTLSGSKSFSLMKGWFNETLPKFSPPEPIALLRLDGDWYDSTMICLESLFPHVAPGGLIIIDDYYTWDGCSRAVHDYFSRHSVKERIRSFRDICFIEKAKADKPDNRDQQ
jgi:O-methyltransferase